MKMHDIVLLGESVREPCVNVGGELCPWCEVESMPEMVTLTLTRAQLEGLEVAFSYAWRDMLDDEYGPASQEEQGQVTEVESAVKAQVRGAGWTTYAL